MRNEKLEMWNEKLKNKNKKFKNLTKIKVTNNFRKIIKKW